MQRLSTVVFACLASLAVANVSHATKFAVLLETSTEPACVVGNPLYTGSGTSGENPLHGVTALTLYPAELWQGAPATLEVLLHESLPGDLPPAPKGALVFGISLTDQATGNAIHQLLKPVTLAVKFDGAVNPNNYVFSSLNEATGVWGEFQKGKANRDARIVCGTTDHFSYFYIAAVPEPSTLALATLAGGLALAAGRRHAR
jgi:hypothetical protein